MHKAPRVRLGAEERRSQLVDEAEAMISRDGFATFSIAGLAERVQMTRAGVLHHFASREDLLLAVLDRKEAESATITAAHIQASGAQDSREIFDLLVRHNLDRPEVIRLFSVLAAESIASDHPAHEHMTSRLQRGAQQLAPLLKGYSRAPNDIAIEILSFMDGLQTNWLRDPGINYWERWKGFADAYFAGLARTDTVRSDEDRG